MTVKNTVLFILFLFSCLFSQTWTTQNSNTTQNLWDAVFYDVNSGVAVGTGGVIIKTTNAGADWIIKNSGTTAQLIGVNYLSDKPNILFTWGMDSPIMKSTNYGETWNAVSLIGHSGMLGGGWVFNESVIIVALGSQSFSLSKILKTTNGGVSWDTVFNPIGGGWISYMHFPTTNTGYATVSGGGVYKTTNQGTTWTTLNVGTPLWMSAVFFKDENLGFVGGGSYTTLTGTLFKTTNGGNSWNSIPQNYASAKIAFLGAGKNTGIGLGADETSGSGVLFRSTDGGDSWTKFTATDSIYGFHFINENYGYAVGKMGTIRRYGTPTSVENNPLAERNFILYGNYPNPFNPATNIKYYLPERSFVKITVYDISGNRIAVLDEKMEDAGEHNIKWTAGNTYSGVYFYDVTAGTAHRTGKMLLLK